MGFIYDCMQRFDAMVTGNIRHYAASIEKLKKVVDARPGEEIFGMTMIVSKGKTILVADTNVTELPSAERLINIFKSCAYSTFIWV